MDEPTTMVIVEQESHIPGEIDLIISFYNLFIFCNKFFINDTIMYFS